MRTFWNGQLRLLDDPNTVARFRSLEMVARLYRNLIKDFGMEALNAVPKFQVVKRSMLFLAEGLIRTLSTEKPGVLGATRLAYLITALWRLEETGLLYMGVQDSAEGWDITLSRPLQRWDLDLSLQLLDSDKWSLVSDEHLSYSLHYTGNETELSPSLPLLNVANSRDEIIAECQPGTKSNFPNTPQFSIKHFALDRDGNLAVLSDALDASVTLQASQLQSILLLGPLFDTEETKHVSVCPVNGRACTSFPLVPGRFGYGILEVIPSALGFRQFKIDSNEPNSRPLHITLEGEFETVGPETKSGKTRLYNKGQDWWIDTDLDYTFPREIPSTNYFATTFFTISVWLTPAFILIKLWPKVSKGKADTDIATRMKQNFLKSRFSSKVLYCLTGLYMAVLNTSLVYYWAFWKLIPYSKFLVAIGKNDRNSADVVLVVILGSIVSLLTLADFESQYQGTKPAKKTD
eukprot:Gregarina_sp_Poly_1__10856@NODE_842_length_6017_cov_94_978151_g609_i0_p2_GENE_NODE_842_length_6017_cov_94_978151_g609_i0NODE_842_length_6017_cov_94_978151_g609_i0_p2_ORF_typecomplete_len462_score55_96_NODE_842_length_6017_cov_94_978151_g609_i032334618